MKLHHLHARREKAAQRLRSLPYVVGVGWGSKVTGRKDTGERCLTVLVSRKHRKELLARHHRIPRAVDWGGKRVPTDVVVLGKLRLESVRYVQTGNQLGTAGIFARRNAEMLAVSCAHVFYGDDGVLGTSDFTRYYNQQWLPLGPSVAVQEDKGSTLPEEWGMFDGGVARIDDPQFAALVGPLTAAQVFDHVAEADKIAILPGKPVFAERADGVTLRATVMATMTSGTNSEFGRHDLLIRHAQGDGLTRVGDSGLLWRLQEDGRPLALHLGSYRSNSAGLGTISATFFVQRASRRFGVQLLDRLRAE
jgi:hypothetical protein